MTQANEFEHTADSGPLVYVRQVSAESLIAEGAMPADAHLPKGLKLYAVHLADGRRIAVAAAAEDLVAVSGPGLARAAWHIGNRHTPCQIEADRLVIARDHVIEAMLRQLGVTLTAIRAPFLPEGGAYGHGRTMGHDHGHFHG